MTSKYWDDFEKRIKETVEAIKENKVVPVRRVAIFITNKCNFRCKYCNVHFGNSEMSEEVFDSIVKKYGDSSIIHITGGEPSTVKWLYPYIENKENVRFHLNTNAFLEPPRNVKRLKISLDTKDQELFDSIVQVKGAFTNTINNIKKHSKRTITSITCVLSKKTYLDSPEFMRYCREEFPGLYAVFFSCYKGDNPEFIMSEKDVDTFFNETRFKLEKEMDKESLGLFKETLDEKFRIFGKNRFPENINNKTCYLSLSERVFDYNGNEYTCSHLFRDGVFNNDSKICNTCRNGCNRRLVKFNEEVEKRLEGSC